MKRIKLIALILALCTLLTAAGCKNNGSADGTGGTAAGSLTGSESETSTSVIPQTPDGPEKSEKSDLPQKAAAEGMVLLKNEENILPLKKGSTVALFGKGQIDMIKGGTGSGDVRTAHIAGLLEGLEAKESEGKVSIYSELSKKYKKNSSYSPSASDLKNAAGAADTAIFVITRNSGEGSDRSAAAGDYYLSAEESALIKNLVKYGFKNIIAVLNVGGIIDTTALLSFPEIKAIMLAWQPGQDGGYALADLLTGDVTPSGHLSDTFAKSYGDYPTSETFGESADYVRYTEDIYVGYRWFETFDPGYSRVNFEFGFGLSYTSFEYGDIVFTENADDITAELTVKNVGSYPGKEVVQMYFSAPQGKLGKPGKELCAFAKTGEIAPGQTEKVTLTVPKYDLSSYDDTGKVQKSAYITEAGDYLFYIGNSIRNAGEAGVRYTYTVGSTVVNEQLTERMRAKLLDYRLLSDGSYENIWDDSGLGAALSDQPLKIEAEDYYRKHEHAEYTFNSGATVCGLKILTSDAGNRYAIFALDAPDAGDYNITLGIGNENGNISKAVKVYVNGALQSGTLDLPDTKGFWKIAEVGSLTIKLDKGLNFVKVEFACGDKFQGFFDYVIIAPGEGSEKPPVIGKAIPVSADAPTRIEGEDYSEKTDDVGTEDISAGPDKGGISLKNLHSEGYFVSYRLNAAEAGDYRVTIRAANGLGAANKACFASVNGRNQSGFGYSIAYTGTESNQWFNFTDIDAGMISLEAGDNILTFTVIERMGNLDYFILERAAASPEKAENNGGISVSASPAISFDDLIKDPSLMGDFLKQLSDSQLVFLLHGHGESVPHGTGSIGGIVDFGIPSAETADGPAGVNLYVNTTAWPIETLMACTWNTELMRKVGNEIAAEAERYNVDIWLAPGANVHRNPLCGRNFEYYSEDPYLSGVIASSLITGVQEKGIGATIKHFVCNEKETNRGHSDSRVSERALREIYLRPFEIAVRSADPYMIMTSYNKVNGVETAESADLITGILYGEWGYGGAVCSDWWNDSIQYREVLAGQCLKMKSGQEAVLLGALKSGLITREQLEEMAARVLALVMKTKAPARISGDSCITVSGSEKTVIKSIDATWRSSEIGMEECKDTGKGYNTTNTYEGQWLIFVIDVEKAGKYKVNFRTASPDGSGAIKFEVDGKSSGTARNTKKTGDWQKWADSDGSVTLNLTEGRHQLKLSFTQGGFNINTLTFTPS